MKYYPVSDAELRNLTLTNTAATFAFSVASACGVFALDLTKDFAMATGVPAATFATWGGFRLTAIAVGVIASLAGVALIVWRQRIVSDLKTETEFE